MSAAERSPVNPATDWLRAQAAKAAPAIRRRDGLDGRVGPVPSGATAAVRAITVGVRRPAPDPVILAERTGVTRRARGMTHGEGKYGVSSTGSVQWWVPEGAEFEIEQARGYTGRPVVQGLRHDPHHIVLVSFDELRDDELEDLTAVYPEEHEDWADYPAIPPRATVRAGGWIDRDWTGCWEAEVDEWVDHLIEHSDWAFDGDEPIYDRIQQLWTAYRKGELPSAARYAQARRVDAAKREAEEAERTRRIKDAQLAALRRLREERAASGPRPSPEAAKEAASHRDEPSPLPAAGHNGAPPARTAGLPTDDAGRVDPDAWEAFWA